MRQSMGEEDNLVQQVGCMHAYWGIEKKIKSNNAKLIDIMTGLKQIAQFLLFCQSSNLQHTI